MKLRFRKPDAEGIVILVFITFLIGLDAWRDHEFSRQMKFEDENSARLIQRMKDRTIESQMEMELVERNMRLLIHMGVVALNTTQLWDGIRCTTPSPSGITKSSPVLAA